MEQGTLLLIGLVVVLVAVAVFSFTPTSRGPFSTPPNPNAEFGVTRQKYSFFRSPPPSTKEPRQESPRTESEPPTKEELLKKHVNISPKNARSRDAKKEYVQIVYSLSASERINISNWTVSNSRGASFKIGTVTNFPGISQFSNQDQLVLPPGGKVNIITGASPRGENFRANKCVAYFNQFHAFTPPLSSSCPRPRDEPGQDGFSDICFTYVRGLSSCKMILSPPLNIGNQCREYINNTVSYAGCIANHKQDTDFYKNEWWVYLARPDPMWSDVRDTITLKNDLGEVVKTYSYN